MSRGTSPSPAAEPLLRALKTARARNARVTLDAVTERLRPGFARWMGTEAWDALLARARSEAAMAPPGEDVDATILVSVADVLTRLVGPSLALQLIQQSCAAPDESP